MIFQGGGSGPPVPPSGFALDIKDRTFGMVTVDRRFYSYELELINLPSMKGKI